MKDEHVEQLLERVDPGKREFLRRLIIGSAFAVPTIASFGLDGLSVYEASAQVANS